MTEAPDPVASAFACGDDDALRHAYDEHGPLVYSFCRRRLDDDRAKDVTQDVFVSAWRARHQFDPSKGTLAGWLMGITKNRLIDHVRSEERHTRNLERSVSEPDDVHHHAAHDVDLLGDQLLVAAALDSLPERAKTVIELVYFGDLTHDQVAEKTALPLGTVKSDIRRGLARIRTHLENAHE